MQTRTEVHKYNPSEAVVRPECAACGTILRRSRGTPIHPRRHCSSCGLALGRREPPVPAWLVPRQRTRRARRRDTCAPARLPYSRAPRTLVFARAEELLERLNAPRQPPSRPVSPKRSPDRPSPRRFRPARELDVAERDALAERDKTVDRRTTRAMLGYVLPSALAGLVAHAVVPAFPFWWAPLHAAVFISWLAGAWIARCPNCRHRPHGCGEFCAVCGHDTLVPGVAVHPYRVCAACTSVIGSVRDPRARGRGGRSVFPRIHCSTCGLRLGRHNTATGYDRPPAGPPSAGGGNETAR